MGSIEYDLHTQRIYEFGNAHGGDAKTFREMVATIAANDPDGLIKVQIFDMDLLDPFNTSEGAVASRKAQVTPALLKHFHRICDQYDMAFGASVFQAELLDNQIEYDLLDFLKVPSPEFCDWRVSHGALVTLMDRAIEYDIPLYASTGLSTESEATCTMELHMERLRQVDFTLMHCVSEYPPTSIHPSKMNVTKLLCALVGCRFGFSDHDPTFKSMSLLPADVSVVEKHVQLAPGHILYRQHPDAAVSLDINKENIDKFVMACPDGLSDVQLDDDEVDHPAIRVWTTTRQIEQGDHFIQGKNVIARRATYATEETIPPDFDIQTQKALYNIPANATLERSMLLPICR